MITLSAADLIKRSAKQILYLRQHPEKVIVSKEQLQGVEEQKRHTKSPFVEMRGTYELDEIRIFFSVDEVQVEGSKVTLIEHKAVNDDVQLWYFEKSIMQTGAYHSLALHSTKLLETATFYVKLGNEKRYLDLEGKVLKSRLNFAEEQYDVVVGDPEEVTRLLHRKAEATVSWEVANRFNEATFHSDMMRLIKKRRANVKG